MMKICITLLMLSGSLLALDWAQNLDKAFATGKKEHKNVMVLVEGEHCRWCKKMKGRTLTDEGIEERLKKYVVVKVMREDKTAMAKLPPIDGVPTIFFMDDDKRIIEKVVGYFNVEDFTSYINDVETKQH